MEDDCWFLCVAMKYLTCGTLLQERRVQGLYCHSEFETKIFINSPWLKKKKGGEDEKHNILTCPVLKSANVRSHQIKE